MYVCMCMCRVAHVDANTHIYIYVCMYVYIYIYIYMCIYLYTIYAHIIFKCRSAYMYIHVHACFCIGISLFFHAHTCTHMYTHICTYMVTRSVNPPPMLHGPGCPYSPVGCCVGSLFLLWGGCGGFGILVQLKLLSLGFRVKRYNASSRQGLKEGWGCRFVRVDSSCSVKPKSLHLGGV